ncbi:hypothetical protein F4604DRAFT_1877523 [Suillus subluteus]|nr:hypothetical protein F4604DRAFT_1877523 [Suillus subluteus]
MSSAAFIPVCAVALKLSDLRCHCNDPSINCGPQTSSPQPQFEEDNIQVQYHPNSQCPMWVYHFEEYGHSPGAPIIVPPVEPEPWCPFRTQIDFEVAGLALEAALTHQQLDRLLNLIHRSKHEDFTLRNRKDIRDTWDAASFKLTPGDDKIFQVFYCSIWDWAVDLLQDPQVSPHFVFDAKQLSKFNGDRFVRFIHDPWTANSFWEYCHIPYIQLQIRSRSSKIPQDSKPLAFILYADKAKLSSFGRAKGYPVVTWCANLPTVIRNGEGLGGGRVVGWLPIHFNFKNAVWHQSFMKILACLAPLLKVGSAVKCWDDLVCVFYPMILILSADYEEQSVMALICGLMGKFPCLICLVPRNELSKTSNNSFDMMEHTDVHQALSHNKLHFNDEGLFSDHQWAKLQKWIEHSGRQAAVLIDNLFNSFLCWRNLNHFDQVVSVSFSDVTKYEDISKLIVFASHNIFNHEQDLEAYLLLRCIRSYVEFNMYVSLDVHTEDTINDGQKALATLMELINKYIEDTLEICDKSWNFPKKHLSAHLFDNIEAKGVSQNYTTKPNEKMHGPLKNAYQDCTNFKNVTEQVTKSLADIEASNTGNPAFVQFHIKLNVFLNHAFNTNGIPFPDGRRVQLAADDMITEYQFLKVNYESLVDWRTSTNYLRCSPMFHGLPQYDFVILQTEVGVIFTQLLLVFTCTVGNDQYPIVLTLPYDQPVGACPRKDKDFNFWQVKAKPRVSTEFFLVQSIVRGCVLVEDSSRPNEALVIDTLNTDMFLRMKEIRTNTIAG